MINRPVSQVLCLVRKGEDDRDGESFRSSTLFLVCLISPSRTVCPEYLQPQEPDLGPDRGRQRACVDMSTPGALLLLPDQIRPDKMRNMPCKKQGHLDQSRFGCSLVDALCFSVVYSQLKGL